MQLDLNLLENKENNKVRPMARLASILAAYFEREI